MQYMGGKTRIAKHIAEAILRTGKTKYTEPFVGGASVLQRVAPQFSTVIASDACEDLILLYRAVQDGWIPPSEMSKELYDSLKKSEPSALRGFAGFGCSFGGKWFGGLIENSPKHGPAMTSRSLQKLSETIGHVSFEHLDYRQAPVDENTVVYCDPPYSGTTRYSSVEEFDHETFWRTVQLWADSGATVLVSEYTCPLK